MGRSPTRSLLDAGSLLLATTMPALADNPHTAFDGDYFGQREAISPLSGELCATGTLHSLTIRNGQLTGDGGDIDGRVFASGFFRATAQVFGLAQPFEGRIENGALLGGLVSPDGACIWLVRMVRLDSDG